MTERQDFQEIGHTGGKVTFGIRCDADGRLGYSVGYSHSRPTAATLVGIYAHPDGFACGNIKMGGIGDAFNLPPFPNCITVFVASDSHGKFGHECPGCQKHFRTSSIPAVYPLTCPYCGLRHESWHFLTPPQKKYIKHYVETLEAGMQTVQPGTSKDVVIDMDKVADDIASGARADFYYSSTTQQTAFNCHACNCFNDILGRYGYCASCGTRNNLAVLRAALADIRAKLNAHTLAPNDAVKQSVSEFDSCARNYTEQLESDVPMKASRSRLVKGLLFHNADRFDEAMRSAFDIHLLRDVGEAQDFVRLMFHRRHVFEHGGGVADARYLEESGDTTVAEGMLIRETPANVNRLIDCLLRMTETLDRDFHEIFPPERYCIDMEEARKKRIADHNRGR